MQTRLFVLNLPYFFSESKVRDILKGCDVTSVMFHRTIHGVMATIQTGSEVAAGKVETILGASRLPGPLGVIRGQSCIGPMLGDTLAALTKNSTAAYSDVS